MNIQKYMPVGKGKLMLPVMNLFSDVELSVLIFPLQIFCCAETNPLRIEGTNHDFVSFLHCKSGKVCSMKALESPERAHKACY